MAEWRQPDAEREKEKKFRHRCFALKRHQRLVSIVSLSRSYLENLLLLLPQHHPEPGVKKEKEKKSAI